MNKKYLLSLLASLGLTSNAHALMPNIFTQIEYHLNIKTDTVLSALSTANKQDTATLSQIFDFVEFKNTTSIHLVTYIDTHDCAFKAHNIIIRVREDPDKPQKSKITVKLRASNPNELGKFQNYNKAELDFSDGKLEYSTNYDLPYSPDKLPIQALNIEQVFEIIKQNSNAWEIISPIYLQYKTKFRQTVVMKIYTWEGKLKSLPDQNLKLDFQLWTPVQANLNIKLAELSFKGSINEKTQLEEDYQWLTTKLKKIKIANENQVSKTSNVYKISPNFNSNIP